jgi:glycosyltransferase involved in cell wall biosynthesis
VIPRVSIIVPAFNRTEYLKLAIGSAFAQTISDWELILADDGSDEETRAYLRSIDTPPVRILWLSHCGNPSRVRNAAIAAARGRYLAFLDSDDVWVPAKLEQQLAALGANSQCRWSYTACNRIDAGGRLLVEASRRLRSPSGGWIFEPLLELELSIAMPTVMAERALVEEVGGFDERQLFGEFHDLCLRLALRSEVVALREPLCSVRAHREHYSGDRTAAFASWMQLYEKFAGMVTSAKLKAVCARMRAQTALHLARSQGDSGNLRATWSILRDGAVFSSRHWRLWGVASLNLLRPAVPLRWRKALPRVRHHGVAT